MGYGPKGLHSFVLRLRNRAVPLWEGVNRWAIHDYVLRGAGHQHCSWNTPTHREYEDYMRVAREVLAERSDLRLPESPLELHRNRLHCHAWHLEDALIRRKKQRRKMVRYYERKLADEIAKRRALEVTVESLMAELERVEGESKASIPPGALFRALWQR